MVDRQLGEMRKLTGAKPDHRLAAQLFGTVQAGKEDENE